MIPDPFRLAVAVVPLAAYCASIALVNARRKPFITTGGCDLAALGAALTGLVLVGPIELFRPQVASAEYGSYVWLFLLIFYWLWLWLAVLLTRPRLVVYNVSDVELRPVLSEAARKIDPEARWAGDSLALPKLGVHLHVESFEFMRNVSLISNGAGQDLAGWRRLGGELHQRLQSLNVGRSPRSIAFFLIALLLMTLSTLHLAANPNQVAQAVREVFTY